MKSLSLAACTALLLLASPAAADERESYSGQWALDKSASALEDPPNSVELGVLVEGNDLKVHRRVELQNGQVHQRRYTYIANGQPQTIPIGDDSNREVVSSWDGTRLKIHSKMNQQGTDFSVDSEWRILDANRISIQNKLNHPTRKGEWTEVFVRKETK